MHKILVIDNNFLLLDLLKELLILNGFCAITASDYQEGYELLTVEKPTLIVSDYPIFDFDSLIILQNICQEAATQKIPLIFMLGYQIIQIPEWHNLIQEQEILVKPFSSKILLEKIHTLLQISPTDPTPEHLKPLVGKKE